MIKLLRVDHRLLHGQVAFSWAQQLDSDAILLANDDLVNDSLRQNIIKFAKPTGVKVISKSIEDSIRAIKSGITDKYNLFIIVESIKDASILAERLGLEEINIGGTFPKPGTKKIGTSVYVDDEDLDILHKLVNEDYDIYIQGVPANNKVYIKDII